jgi:hypothetical protein
MTTVVAWERQAGELSELIVASDSRLSGGEAWDACAKIFDIGRSDAVFAFAGDTWRALPLVLQAVATTRSYEGSALKTLDLPQFAGHLERVLNTVLAQATGTASKEPPGCEFLLAGWSWTLNDFFIYRYSFDRKNWRFTANAVSKRLPGSIKAAGRGRQYLAIGDGATGLTGSLAKAYNSGSIAGALDYHPLEYLYLQTIDPAWASVGGPVQAAKIYRSIRVEHLTVEVDSQRSLSGRPLLPYERTNLRCLVRSAGKWSVES